MRRKHNAWFNQPPVLTRHTLGVRVEVAITTRIDHMGEGCCDNADPGGGRGGCEEVMG